MSGHARKDRLQVDDRVSASLAAAVADARRRASDRADRTADASHRPLAAPASLRAVPAGCRGRAPKAPRRYPVVRDYARRWTTSRSPRVGTTVCIDASWMARSTRNPRATADARRRLVRWQGYESSACRRRSRRPRQAIETGCAPVASPSGKLLRRSRSPKPVRRTQRLGVWQVTGRRTPTRQSSRSFRAGYDWRIERWARRRLRRSQRSAEGTRHVDGSADARDSSARGRQRLAA